MAFSLRSPSANYSQQLSPAFFLPRLSRIFPLRLPPRLFPRLFRIFPLRLSPRFFPLQIYQFALNYETFPILNIPTLRQTSAKIAAPTFSANLPPPKTKNASKSYTPPVPLPRPSPRLDILVLCRGFSLVRLVRPPVPLACRPSPRLDVLVPCRGFSLARRSTSIPRRASL